MGKQGEHTGDGTRSAPQYGNTSVGYTRGSAVRIGTYGAVRPIVLSHSVSVNTMGVATGGASRGRAPPFCLSGGAGPPNFLRVLTSDNHSDSQRARNLRTVLSMAGMSLNYRLTDSLQS